jgi:6-phosphogluconolactonase
LAKDRAGFERWHLFLADERYVPYEHAECTLRVWQQALLDHVGIPAANVHALNVAVPLELAAPLIASECV